MFRVFHTVGYYIFTNDPMPELDELVVSSQPEESAVSIVVLEAPASYSLYSPSNIPFIRWWATSRFLNFTST